MIPLSSFVTYCMTNSYAIRHPLSHFTNCIHLNFVLRTFQKMSFSTLLSTSGWWTAGHLAVTSWWGPMPSPAWDVSFTPPQTRPQTTGPQQVKDDIYMSVKEEPSSRSVSISSWKMSLMMSCMICPFKREHVQCAPMKASSWDASAVLSVQELEMQFSKMIKTWGDSFSFLTTPFSLTLFGGNTYSIVNEGPMNCGSFYVRFEKRCFSISKTSNLKMFQKWQKAALLLFHRIVFNL